jgi:hypothetical protein
MEAPPPTETLASLASHLGVLRRATNVAGGPVWGVCATCRLESERSVPALFFFFFFFLLVSQFFFWVFFFSFLSFDSPQTLNRGPIYPFLPPSVPAESRRHSEMLFSCRTKSASAQCRTMRRRTATFPVQGT